MVVKKNKKDSMNENIALKGFKNNIIKMMAAKSKND